MQHLAGSGEIVVPHEMFAALPDGDRRALRLVERFSAKVKGVEEALDLARLGLPRERVEAVVVEAEERAEARG